MVAAFLSDIDNVAAPHSPAKPNVLERKIFTKQVEKSEMKNPAETFEVTAYTAGPESTGKRPGDAGYGITASGKPVQEGVTAACPPDLSFGTVLRIEGIGERVCHDRGGAIKGKRLDVYMSSLSDAREFGRKKLKVEIIEEGE